MLLFANYATTLSLEIRVSTPKLLRERNPCSTIRNLFQENTRLRLPSR